MGNRIAGEGSIYRRRGGKYQVTFPTGLYRNDKNGNPVREYIYKYCDTAEQAKEVLHDLQTKKMMGVNFREGKIKTGEYIEYWIEEVKKNSLSTSTLTSYRNAYYNHIKEYIGDIPINKLTNAQIQAALDKSCSSSSQFQKTFTVLHGAIKYAMVKRLMNWDPCTGIVFPADDSKKAVALTMNEQKRFLKALQGEYYADLFILYLYSGLRLGEALALRWSDTNLNTKRIWVDKKAIAVVDRFNHTAKQVIQPYPKSISSIRGVVITDELVRILTKHKEDQIEYYNKLGIPWSEENLVFVNTKNKMVQASNIDDVFNRIIRKAGIVGVTIHSLRHSYATRCYEAGVEIKIISEQLGHKNVKTTQNIYLHLFKDMKEKEINKLSEIDNILSDCYNTSCENEDALINE